MDILNLFDSIATFTHSNPDIMYPIIVGTVFISLMNLLYNIIRDIILFKHNCHVRNEDNQREDQRTKQLQDAENARTAIVQRAEEARINLAQRAESERIQASIDAQTLWKERMTWINTVRNTYANFVLTYIQFQKTQLNNKDFDEIKLNLQEKLILLKLYFCPDKNKCSDIDLKNLETNSGKNDQIVDLIDKIQKELEEFHHHKNKYLISEFCYKRCIQCRMKCIFNECVDDSNIICAYDNEKTIIDDIVNPKDAKLKYSPILSKQTEYDMEDDGSLDPNEDYDIPEDCPEDLFEKKDSNPNLCEEIMIKYNIEICQYKEYYSELNNDINELLDAIRCYIKVEWYRNKKQNIAD